MKAINPERVCRSSNPFRVGNDFENYVPGFSRCSNPGLKLANTFGVSKHPGLKLANASGVSKHAALKLANA